MNLLRKFRFYQYLISLSKEVLEWFYRLPNVITNGINKAANQYNVYGNSKQEYITIDDVQYKIPDGYTLLEKANFPSGSYLTTPITPAMLGNTNPQVEFKYQALVAGDKDWLGTDSMAASTVIFNTTEVTGGSYIRWGTIGSRSLTYETGKSMSDVLTYGVSAKTFKINGTTTMNVYVNNELVGTNVDSSVSMNSTEYIKLNAGRTGSQSTSVLSDFYFFKAYNDTTTLCLLYPMKNSSDVVEFYDFITNTFITPTSGTLSAGLEAPTPTTPVEIQSCGDLAGQKNQLVDPSAIRATQTINGVTFTNNNDGSYSVNGTATANALFIITSTSAIPLTANHAIYLCGCASGASTNTYSLRAGNSTFEDVGNGAIFTYNGTNTNLLIRVMSGVTISNKVFKPQFIDLTQMFGSGNEPSTVADAKTKIAEVMGGEKDYYEYNAGSDYYKIPVIAGSNCGCVDLGSLTWTLLGGSPVSTFYTTISDKMQTTAGGLYCKLYTKTTEGTSSMSNMTMRGTNGAGSFFIRNTSYTDATVFKQAMSGVYLYYQRTDDTSWTAPTTTNIYLDEPLRKVGNYIDKIHFGQGKNLFDLSNYPLRRPASYSIDGNTLNVLASDNEAWSTVFSFNLTNIFLKAGTYTFSFNSSTVRVQCDKQVSTETPTSVFTDSVGDKTFTLTEDCNINFKFLSTSTYPASISNIQLEQGSTATTYHPYSDTPQVIRNVGNKVLDGTNLNIVSTGTTYGVACQHTTIGALAYASGGTYTNFNCSHLEVRGSGDVENSLSITSANYGIRFTFNSSICPDDGNTRVAEVNTWLAAQYSAGTPFTMGFPLATSTSEVISLPTLIPASGTTIYTVPTKVQPFVSVNLFDKDTMLRNRGVSLGALGRITEVKSTVLSAVIPVEYSKTYTVSRDASSTNTRFACCLMKVHPDTLSTTSATEGVLFQEDGVTYGYAHENTADNSFSFTVNGSDIKYAFIYLSNLSGDTSAIVNLQIQEGSSATTYEPYCNGMEVQAYVTEETSTPATIDSNGVVTATGSVDSNGVTTLNGTIDSNGVVTL